MAGTIIAVLLYKLIKSLEYETAQGDGEDEKLFLPTSERREAETPSSVALSTVSARSAAPAQDSSQSLALPNHAKTPIMHDKEFEKSGFPNFTGD
jgi:hypothetical protein